MTIIIYFPLKNPKLIPHVKSTRAICLNDRKIGPKTKAMLFCPAPAKLLSWNQKPSLSQHVYSFASLQHVWTRLSQRVPQDYLHTASAVMPVVRFTCCARSTRSKYHIRGLKRWTRMHDVHVRKRMSFAGSAGSICKLIHMWELLGHKPVCSRMKGIGGHVVPFSACRIAVIKRMLLSEPICTEIHGSLTPGLLKESEAKWWTRKTAVPMAVDFVSILFRNSKWVYHEGIYPLKLSKVSTSSGK